MNSAVRDEIIERVDHLSVEAQRKLLDIVRQLDNGLPRGVPGEEFWRKTAGLIPKEDAEEMLRAIEEDCERIDPADCHPLNLQCEQALC